MSSCAFVFSRLWFVQGSTPIGCVPEKMTGEDADPGAEVVTADVQADTGWVAQEKSSALVETAESADGGDDDANDVQPEVVKRMWPYAKSLSPDIHPCLCDFRVFPPSDGSRGTQEVLLSERPSV